MQVTWIKSRKEATDKAKEVGGRVKIRKGKSGHAKAKKLAVEKIEE